MPIEPDVQAALDEMQAQINSQAAMISSLSSSFVNNFNALINAMEGIFGANMPPSFKGFQPSKNNEKVGVIQGPPGPMGQTGPIGLTGQYFEPSVSYSGVPGTPAVLSWDLLQATEPPTMPPSLDIMGPTGATGAQGIQGDPGAGVHINGSVNEVADLPATGSAGDAWLLAEDDPAVPGALAGDLFVWDPSAGSWLNVGNIRGPQGTQGIEGPAGANGTSGTNGIDGGNGFSWWAIANASTLNNDGGAGQQQVNMQNLSGNADHKPQAGDFVYVSNDNDANKGNYGYISGGLSGQGFTGNAVFLGVLPQGAGFVAIQSTAANALATSTANPNALVFVP